MQEFLLMSIKTKHESTNYERKNSIVVTHPEISKEWHPIKNNKFNERVSFNCIICVNKNVMHGKISDI